MNQALTRSILSELSVAERLTLLEATWASLEQAPDTVPMPDWHKAELDRRLAAPIDKGGAKDWTEVRQAILDSLRS